MWAYLVVMTNVFTRRKCLTCPNRNDHGGQTVSVIAPGFASFYLLKKFARKRGGSRLPVPHYSYGPVYIATGRIEYNCLHIDIAYIDNTRAVLDDTD